MGRRWKKLTRTFIPHWIAWPLLWLGIVYVISFPFARDWYAYGLALAIAVVLGAWARRRYRVTILERSDKGVVYWVRRVKKDEEKPASAVVMPRQ